MGDQRERSLNVFDRAPARRLIIRPGGIGDCILALPAMEHLRGCYTEVWLPSALVPVLQAAPVPFAARAIPATGIDLLGLPYVEPPAELIAELRSFDSIVSWYGANRSEFREQVAALGLPFQFLDALPPAGARVHAADFFLQQAGGKGRAVPAIAWKQTQSGNYAVIHPFSGSARKNWPLDRFREIAARLPLPVRWNAGPEEPLDGATRFDNLSDLARWLAEARLYIGNDSGITHLAAAAGTPVVAIFGPSDPAVWAPRGDRVSVVSGQLENITADMVFQAARRVLAVSD